ncbi:hypothetical protein CNR22_20840 [Sphingobacteriaceae bacterium]|nr:hypothetical protein CNR22_20840 [Sphingobacteriaceae bacterium]
MDLNTYFSDEALARFVSAQGKVVEKIVCHLWQNTVDKNGSVELIDNLELHFTDKQKLTISCNENGDGLDAINFNYKAAVAELEKEFDGKIKLFAVNASTTKMWEDVIGLTLESVRIIKEGDYHKAGSALLVFGKEKRIVSINPLDGLVIDYYEED